MNEGHDVPNSLYISGSADHPHWISSVLMTPLSCRMVIQASANDDASQHQRDHRHQYQRVADRGLHAPSSAPADNRSAADDRGDKPMRKVPQRIVMPANQDEALVVPSRQHRVGIAHPVGRKAYRP